MNLIGQLAHKNSCQKVKNEHERAYQANEVIVFEVFQGNNFKLEISVVVESHPQNSCAINNEEFFC